MEEIVKHINDTNASYRALGAGDAKNTDLFLDSEHYELFKDVGEQVKVRFNRENLTKAILFIESNGNLFTRVSKQFIMLIIQK